MDLTCWPYEGYVQNCSDCNDQDINIYPEADCVDATTGCDGKIGADCSCQSSGNPTLYYRDSDGDGYGVEADTTTSCTELGTGWTTNTVFDCDDNDAAVYPGASCNGSGASACGIIGADCTCQSTTGSGVTYYADTDGDGAGDPNNSSVVCGEPAAGWVDNALDCDDTVFGWAQGDECSTGCGCITFVDPSCYCAFTDADKDGVCDGLDVCPTDDDKRDVDGNGVPDCNEELCFIENDSFDVKMLRTNANSP